MIWKLICCLFILGVPALVNAQEIGVDNVFEDLLESLGENMSDDSDIQEILDDLEYFKQNPLHINDAKIEDLLRLHLLSDVQINNLNRFIDKSGSIFSIYELAAIDGFNPDIVQKIEPFISFEIEDRNKLNKRSSGALFLKTTRSISDANASELSKYEGSPERYYLRFKHSAANYEVGLVGEKDPGEAFFNQSNRTGFDYNSAFANFRVGKGSNRIFVGDYSVRFGQGLVAWQGFSMGKSAETTNVFKTNQGIKSYSSTDENLFFRGIAGQFKTGHFIFSTFASNHKVDAHIDTINGNPSFGAFQTSGYHRTASEILGENALTQFSGGFNSTFSYDRWSVGFTSIYTRFDAEMIRSDDPYNQFLPDGNENIVAGIDWKGSVNKIYLFGEMAVGKNYGKALISGLMFKPTLNAELSLVYRNMNKTYFSYFSNAFTESSQINDEHAFYMGLKFFPASHWIVSAYADFFAFRWLKYTTSAPSKGAEFFSQLSYNPTKQANFYLRFFQEEKEQRLITSSLRYNEQQLISRLRLNYIQKLNEAISLKSRIEFSFYSKENNEKGILVFQDVNFKPAEKSYSINGRLACFSTNGYNSRLYAYENDLLYSFSVPALFGNGIRTYLNFQKSLSSKFTLWLKLAATHQFAQTNLAQLSNSATKSEIKIQIRYQY